MKTIARGKPLAIALAAGVGLFFAEAGVAHAAPGDLVGVVDFSSQCSSGIGVGITFDGKNLWYSCYASTPDLFRADPTTGAVTATYNIAGGVGSLAYDSSKNVIWAGQGGGTFSGVVVTIPLDASQNVTGPYATAFPVPEAFINTLDDGLAIDLAPTGGGNPQLYVSYDGSTVVHVYDTVTATQIRQFNWTGSGCYNSGVAVGGSLLFQGSDGCSHVWVVNKDTLAPAFNFTTQVAGDPNFRDESLTCDTTTFASIGKQVMWSKEAYAPMRAHAYEIPPGTCGAGGKPPPMNPPSCSLTSVNPGPPKQLIITVQDTGGLASVQVTDSTNATVDVPAFSAGDNSAIVVTATKVDQTQGAHVALHLTGTDGQTTDCDPVVPGEPAIQTNVPAEPVGTTAGGCNVSTTSRGAGLSSLIAALLGLAFIRRRRA